MSSTSIINKRLENFLLTRDKTKDLNCITQDLSDSAKNIANSFSDAQRSSPLFGKLFSVKDNINIKDYLSNEFISSLCSRINKNKIYSSK